MKAKTKRVVREARSKDRINVSTIPRMTKPEQLLIKKVIDDDECEPPSLQEFYSSRSQREEIQSSIKKKRQPINHMRGRVREFKESFDEIQIEEELVIEETFEVHDHETPKKKMKGHAFRPSNHHSKVPQYAKVENPQMIKPKSKPQTARHDRAKEFLFEEKKRVFDSESSELSESDEQDWAHSVIVPETEIVKAPKRNKRARPLRLREKRKLL